MTIQVCRILRIESKQPRGGKASKEYNMPYHLKAGLPNKGLQKPEGAVKASSKAATVCLSCKDDYADLAEECLLAGVCEDCRDVDCLEDLFEACFEDIEED